MFIESRQELTEYVENNNLSVSEHGHNEIVNRILEQDECPMYGEDWSDFLDALPSELFEVA
jgi:hypothetical protein